MVVSLLLLMFHNSFFFFFFFFFLICSIKPCLACFFFLICSTDVRNYVSVLKRRGYHCIVFNHRGCGQQLKTERLFTFGGCDDVREAIKRVEALYPSAMLFLIGCSMGANILVRYLSLPRAERARNIVAAVSISQAYDAERGAQLLPPRYRNIILSKMKKLVRKHEHVLSAVTHVPSLLAVTTCEEFDQTFTIPTHDNQWNDAMHYYRASSCIYVFDKIDVPLLLFNALDDPLVHEELVYAAHEAAATHAHIVGVTTNVGGHLGFMHGWLWPHRESFADTVVAEYFETAFDHAIAERKQHQH